MTQRYLRSDRVAPGGAASARRKARVMLRSIRPNVVSMATSAHHATTRRRARVRGGTIPIICSFARAQPTRSKSRSTATRAGPSAGSSSLRAICSALWMGRLMRLYARLLLRPHGSGFPVRMAISNTSAQPCGESRSISG